MGEVNTAINSRIATIYSGIDSAVNALNGILGALTFYGSGSVTAEMSSGAAGASPPAVDATEPLKPTLDRSSVARASAYAPVFDIPELVEFDSDSGLKPFEKFLWNELSYTAIFDDMQKENIVIEQIWTRRDIRLHQALTDAAARRATRWSCRGVDVSAELLEARQEEVTANFNYAINDGIRSRNIKEAEIAVDDLRFNTAMSAKRISQRLDLLEGFATRLMDAVDISSKMAVITHRAALQHYTDIEVAEFLARVMRYSETLSVKVAQNKADIRRYITNTKIIMDKNRMLTAEFDGDVEKYASQGFKDDAQADLDMMFNELSIKELGENFSMRLKQIETNMDAFIKAMSTNKWFTESMGRVYAQYVTASNQSISLMLQAGSELTRQITS